jgi:hypothetical protein
MHQPKSLAHLYISIYIDGPNAWGVLYMNIDMFCVIILSMEDRDTVEK